VVEQGGEDRWDGEQAGHPLAGHELHERARLEPPQHHVAPADHGEEMRRSPAVDVEQWDDVEHDVVLREPEAELGGEAVEVQLAVGHRDPLRQAGRAARVEELGHRVLVDRRMERLGRAGGEQRLVLVVSDAAGLPVEDDEGRAPGELRGDRLDERAEVGMERDDARRGMVEDVRDLRRGEADVDRVEHCPRFEDAVVRLEEVVGVVGDERDAVAGLNAEQAQRVREPVRPLGERAVGVFAVAIHDADLVAEERRRTIAELEHGQGHEHGSPPWRTRYPARRFLLD